MAYLAIELARTIDEDRYQEAERCHRISKALAARQKQSTNPAQILLHWLQSLAKQEQHIAGLAEVNHRLF
jgi:hypothetical protein